MAKNTPNLESVTTINRDGSRYFLFPADVDGKFALMRRIVGILLIGFYLLLPWIPVNGYPAVFLDIINRRFHLFGITIVAQDLWLLFFLITGVAFFLFYITAFLGRVWCGWACPQTVYLDQVYRRIERWIDGDAPARRKLADAPLSTNKVVRRVIKHGLYILSSTLIVHLFLSYFISIPQLWDWMRTSPAENWGAFLFVIASTLVLYGNFAWFREQLCLIICPYGRIQSALIDDHTVNVAYDEKRGEPRGKIHKGEATSTLGDCVDCHRCVQVCPTGIDIRQGLQLECIACTACIDACDDIMDKVNRPRGLIRYASSSALAGGKTRFIRPRTLLYTGLLLLGMGVCGVAVSGVKSVEATILRMVGMPYYVTTDTIRNQYQVRLINKTTEPVHFSIHAERGPAGMQFTGFDADQSLGAMAEETRTVIATVPRSNYQGPFEVEVEITLRETGLVIERSIDFLGPDPKLLQAHDSTPKQDDDHDEKKSDHAHGN
ncbi:MAG: cytochrome c oxidase accessory protein CcoG [Verrucomicrobiota bacterium]|nr:cytochrome c oxidase accessory protein CcoG [Verrucomicrobiota bacterium]